MQKLVYQFKITLEHIKPRIWRRIQVPDTYSFWDLHVAIQDAMGWMDCHLHQFRIIDLGYGYDKKINIGIPEEDPMVLYNSPEIIPGWKKFIREHFFPKELDSCHYDYDFGDNWIHKVKLEKILPAASDIKYPICIAGERACPPEDCGGVPGYEDLLEIIKNPQHEEYQNMLNWIGSSFDPEKFAPQNISFDDPKERWKLAFEN